MRTKRIWMYIGGLALATAVPALSAADEVRLQRDDVIPVVMMSELNLKTAREGDHFKAEVNDTRMLPWGSRLEGVVNRVERKRGSDPAYMDIEFTTIILPDGHRTEFHGTPISLNKDFVTRDRYGRWEAKKGVQKNTVVLGGIAGGFILGSMIKKPFEGAILGAILGVIGAETDKRVADGNVVIPKGSTVGARVDEDLSIEFDGRWSNDGRNDTDIYGPYDRDGYNKQGYDRYGYDRDGRYNDRYDSTHGSQNDRDRYNGEGYDRYGRDRNGKYDPTWDSTRDPMERDRNNGRDSRGLEIEIDRKSLRYRGDEEPYRNDWVVMVPLEATADQLGFEVSQSRSGDTVWVEKGDDVFAVEQDSKSYRLNGRRDTLPAKAEMRNGILFVPLEAFSKVVRGTVIVNGTKYRPGS